MYLPEHFTETDEGEIRKIIEAFPLAILVAQTSQGLLVNHIPLLWERSDLLIGHVAANNAMHHQISEADDVVAIFRGEDSYVSPNWYPTKPVHHRHVPTWNYQVVHCHGRLAFRHDEKAKRAVVGRLTRHFEVETNGASAWRMADAPADYMTTMLGNIVAFDFRVERIVAKSKLSQNREPADFDAVRAKLDERGQHHLSARMDMVGPRKP